MLLVVLLLLLTAHGLSSLVALAIGRLGAPPEIRYLAPIAAWVCLVVVFALAFRRVGSPVGEIVEAAQRVAEGDFSTRIRARGPRFVRTVGNAFNAMTVRLEAQNRHRRELMADIAHELRTPLTVVQGRLEGLLDGVYPRDDARLAEVLDETRLLARLVEDLRTLANAETGVLTLQKEPTDVPMLIADVVRTFAPEAERAGVTVRVGTAAALRPVHVDPLRIRQVLANLVSNALRYTPSGGMVTIAARDSAEEVTVTVADTGPGIVADELPRIFDRFYKGESSRGSGLGLTIARNLVEAHGGSITAESAPGTGTSIRLRLPIDFR